VVIVPRKIENVGMNGNEFHIFFSNQCKGKMKIRKKKMLSFLLHPAGVNKLLNSQY